MLAKVHGEVRSLIGAGEVATYIPALATVDPSRFGMAVATVDGELHGVGDFRTPFSIQSLSKVFALALVLSTDSDRIWRRIGHSPSMLPFNSLVQLERDRGKPRNPFVNAGALVTVDQLLSGSGPGLLEFLRAESGEPEIAVVDAVARSERRHLHRNAALAHLLASFGNLRNPVRAVLDRYVEHCAIAMSCADLARAGAFLARRGVLADGGLLLSRDDTKRMNATLLVCGMYQSAGEFAYQVGLPAKSGVGGGVLAVVPNRCAVCVWSPGLDRAGNSIAGVAALECFTYLTGWSLF